MRENYTRLRTVGSDGGHQLPPAASVSTDQPDGFHAKRVTTYGGP